MRNTSAILLEMMRKEEFKNTTLELTDDKLRILQRKYCEMLEEFHKICCKNKIKYTIVAGTLIGAIRHGGFIPWDDDIDIVMLREDYEKFKKLKLPQNYYFETPDKTKEISLVGKFKENITYFDILGEEFSKKNKLYLDILPLDYVPNNKIKRFVIGKLVDSLRISYTSQRCFKKYDEFLNEMSKYSFELKINIFLRKILALPARIIGKYNTVKLLEFLLKIEKKNKDFLTIAFGEKKYFGELLEAKIFFPAKKIKFEEFEVYAPNLSKIYLQNRYGDYLKIPSLDEQRRKLIRVKDNWKELLSIKNTNK